MQHLMALVVLMTAAASAVIVQCQTNILDHVQMHAFIIYYYYYVWTVVT